MPDPMGTSASTYDAIYEEMKDYRQEAKRVRELIALESRVDPILYARGYRLLDVACGTGLHAQYLTDAFEVTGLDASPAMLEIARRRLPGVNFHEGDMSDFDLAGQKFHAVTCLFSAIGHMLTKDGLHAAIACMSRHLHPGGVLLVEPWITPDKWEPGRIGTIIMPEHKVVRITQASRKGDIDQLDMHHFVGWPDATQYRFTRHELALYTFAEYLEAFRVAGLDVGYDAHGLMGRGLYIGVKNS